MSRGEAGTKVMRLFGKKKERSRRRAVVLQSAFFISYRERTRTMTTYSQRANFSEVALKKLKPRFWICNEWRRSYFDWE